MVMCALDQTHSMHKFTEFIFCGKNVDSVIRTWWKQITYFTKQIIYHLWLIIPCLPLKVTCHCGENVTSVHIQQPCHYFCISLDWLYCTCWCVYVPAHCISTTQRCPVYWTPCLWQAKWLVSLEWTPPEIAWPYLLVSEVCKIQHLSSCATVCLL